MFVYEKRLEYPIKIKNTNPKLAALIISQYGGPYTGRVRKLIFSGRRFRNAENRAGARPYAPLLFCGLYIIIQSRRRAKNDAGPQARAALAYQ